MPLSPPPHEGKEENKGKKRGDWEKKENSFRLFIILGENNNYSVPCNVRINEPNYRS